MTSGPEPTGVVAHYNLLERLEPAGPGELYRARDTRLGRTVTVRLLPRKFATDRSPIRPRPNTAKRSLRIRPILRRLFWSQRWMTWWTVYRKR